MSSARVALTLSNDTLGCSRDVVRFQVILAILGAIANILISVYLTRRVGIPGVVYGTILSQFFIGFVPYYLFVRRFIKNSLPEPLLTKS